jgi:predicted DNA-binding protein (UPF0251 family)
MGGGQTETNDPEETLSRSELTAATRKALNQLPAEEREVVSLYYEVGLKQEDVSKILSVSQKVVSYRLRNGLDRLRKILTAQGFAVLTPAVLVEALGASPLPAAPAAFIELLRRLSAQSPAAAPSVATAIASGKSNALLGWGLASIAVFAALGGALWPERLLKRGAIP